MNKTRNNFFTFILLLNACILHAQPNSTVFRSDSILMFVPFSDHSGFNGKWNLSLDIPRFLSVYAKERFRVGIVSPLSVRQYAVEQNIDSGEVSRFNNLRKYADYFGVRYIVTAEIKEFSIGRFMVSELQLAGYESFAATVTVVFTLHDAARFNSYKESVVYDGEAEGTVKDKSLGVTLFGKQTDRTNQYFLLDEIAFGTETFNHTIIGEALLKCADDMSTKLEQTIPALVSKNIVLSSSVTMDSTSSDSAIILRRQLVNGEIVIVDGDEVFVNLGSQDGVKAGDLLPVFAGEMDVKDPKTGDILGSRDEKIGDVQVIEIRAEHLSLATIINGKVKIVPKLRVRKVLVR